MLKNKKIGVVVPAYNEEKLINLVVQKMPSFVDLIFIVDDNSNDRTVNVAKESAKRCNKKIKLIEHQQNQGVGASIVTGFKEAIKMKMDIISVMAGDAQMDPSELKEINLPIINNKADCVKGNRLIYRQAWRKIPRIRYLGNSILSLFTKIASGYWHVADSQTGYIALSKEIVQKLPLNDLYRRYGFPNDLLINLNIVRARLKEIPIKPIYNIGEKSGIKLWRVMPTILWLIIRRFFRRLKIKYIIEDFHPLVFFYFLSLTLSLVNIFLTVRLIWLWIENNKIPPINALALVFCIITAIQVLFFAMWFDMDYNKDLKVE